MAHIGAYNGPVPPQSVRSARVLSYTPRCPHTAPHQQHGMGADRGIAHSAGPHTGDRVRCTGHLNRCRTGGLRGITLSRGLAP